jgi:hypothetical protein
MYLMVLFAICAIKHSLLSENLCWNEATCGWALLLNFPHSGESKGSDPRICFLSEGADYQAYLLSCVIESAFLHEVACFLTRPSRYVFLVLCCDSLSISNSPSGCKATFSSLCLERVLSLSPERWQNQKEDLGAAPLP